MRAMNSMGRKSLSMTSSATVRICLQIILRVVVLQESALESTHDHLPSLPRHECQRHARLLEVQEAAMKKEQL